MAIARQHGLTAKEAYYILIVRLFEAALCPVRLGVRTPPFHGGNTGSNPVPDTIPSQRSYNKKSTRRPPNSTVPQMA